jgi:hypothetical protein
MSITTKLLVRLSRMKLEFLLKKSTPETDNARAIVLSFLNPNLFKNENVAVTSKLKFNVICDSLIAYNKRLFFIINLLKNNSVISADWCAYEYRRITYDQLFIDGTVYVDKQKTLREFIRLVTELREQLNIIKDAQIGPQGHNLRQMSRFHTHLSDLIVELIRGSYEVSLSKSR